MWRFAEPVNQSYGSACVHAAILCDLVLDQQLFQSPDIGYRVYIWNYHGGPNQQWRLEFRN